MSDTDTLARPEPAAPMVGDRLPAHEGTKAAHIVDDTGGAVARAYVEGTPLEALCGHVWVPSADPERFPLCSRCKQIRDEATQ